MACTGLQNLQQLLDGLALADRRIAELQAAEAAKKQAEAAKKQAEAAKKQAEEVKKAEEDATQAEEASKADKSDKVRTALPCTPVAVDELTFSAFSTSCRLCQQNVKQLLDGIALADRRIAELQAAEAAKKAAEEKRKAEEDTKQAEDAKQAAEEVKETPVPPPRSKGDTVRDIVIYGNGALSRSHSRYPCECGCSCPLSECQAAAGWHCARRPPHR